MIAVVAKLVNDFTTMTTELSRVAFSKTYSKEINSGLQILYKLSGSINDYKSEASSEFLAEFSDNVLTVANMLIGIFPEIIDYSPIIRPLLQVVWNR